MPGELLTSKTKGPLLLLSMSTPATDKPRALAALTATDLSFLDKIAFSAVPPWCIFDLKSSPLLILLIEPITLPPTTRHRISSPLDSSINS